MTKFLVIYLYWLRAIRCASTVANVERGVPKCSCTRLQLEVYEVLSNAWINPSSTLEIAQQVCTEVFMDGNISFMKKLVFPSEETNRAYLLLNYLALTQAVSK